MRLLLRIVAGAAAAGGVFVLARMLWPEPRPKPRRPEAAAAVDRLRAELNAVPEPSRAGLIEALRRTGTDRRVRRLLGGAGGLATLGVLERSPDRTVSAEELVALVYVEANLLELAAGGGLARAELEQLLVQNPEIELVISRRGVVTAAALDAMGCVDPGGAVAVGELVEMLMTLQGWADVFQQCDADGDGFVAQKELVAGLAELPERLGRAGGLRPVLDELELHGDREVTWAQLCQRLRQSRQLASNRSTSAIG